MVGKRRKLISAVSTLTGTVIGAGILGLPYVIAKSGFFYGLFHIVFLGIIILFVRLYLGEICLRTRGIHQLTGYANIYLGKTGRILMTFSMIFGVYTALVAYIIGEGQSLSFLFTNSINYTFIFSFLFWLFTSFLVAKGINALEEAESYSFFIVISIVILIFFYFIKRISFSNLTYLTKSPITAFLPYGVVLFSYLGFTALPEMEIELKRNEKLMKKAILIGSVIPIIIYILFVVAVVGFAGKSTPEVATIALGKLPTLFGCFTMFTAFFALALALQEMYVFDFKIKRRIAWLFSCFVPFLIVLFVLKYNLATFTQILGVGGSIAGGVAGMLIVIMVKIAKKKGNRKAEYSLKLPLIFAIFLFLLFLCGMIYEFLF